MVGILAPTGTSVDRTVHVSLQALQALRGVQLIAAMTLVAELQDFLRFESPRQLMAYVGLVPSEHSSGPKRRQGAITKAGNSAGRPRPSARRSMTGKAPKVRSAALSSKG